MFLILTPKTFQFIFFRCHSSSSFNGSCDVQLLGKCIPRLNRIDEQQCTLYVTFTYFDFSLGLKAKPHDTMDLCVLLNNNLAQTVQTHPKRFVGLGTLPMQAPDLAVLEMRRCVMELGFPGVQIGSHINNWDLNADELYPFYSVRL